MISLSKRESCTNYYPILYAPILLVKEQQKEEQHELYLLSF